MAKAGEVRCLTPSLTHNQTSYLKIFISRVVSNGVWYLNYLSKIKYFICFQNRCWITSLKRLVKTPSHVGSIHHEKIKVYTIHKTLDLNLINQVNYVGKTRSSSMHRISCNQERRTRTPKKVKITFFGSQYHFLWP